MVPDCRRTSAFKGEDLFEGVHAPPDIGPFCVGFVCWRLVKSDGLCHGDAEGENVPGPSDLVAVSEDNREEEDGLHGVEGSFCDDVPEQRVAVVDVWRYCL